MYIYIYITCAHIHTRTRIKNHTFVSHLLNLARNLLQRHRAARRVDPCLRRQLGQRRRVRLCDGFVDALSLLGQAKGRLGVVKGYARKKGGVGE